MHKKRRLISFQHEEGIIDDKEALSKWEALKHEIADQERRVNELETMTAPEPPLLSEEVFRCNEGALVGGAYEFLMESNNEDLIKLCDKYEVEVRIKSKEEIEIKARLPVELRREFRLKGKPVVAVSAAESVSTSCS